VPNVLIKPTINSNRPYKGGLHFLNPQGTQQINNQLLKWLYFSF